MTARDKKTIAVIALLVALLIWLLSRKNQPTQVVSKITYPDFPNVIQTSAPKPTQYQYGVTPPYWNLAASGAVFLGANGETVPVVRNYFGEIINTPPEPPNGTMIPNITFTPHASVL